MILENTVSNTVCEYPLLQGEASLMSVENTYVWV